VAHELGKASESGNLWKKRATENNLMATMILASRKVDGYVVVPKDRINNLVYSYRIEVKERDTDVRFKLHETRRPKYVETKQDDNIPVQRGEDAPADSGVPEVQTSKNELRLVGGVDSSDVRPLPDSVGSDDRGNSDQERS